MNSPFDFSAVFSWSSKGLVQAGTGKHNKGLSFQLPLPASRLLFLPEVLAAVIHNVSEHYLCAASSSSSPPPCVCSQTQLTRVRSHPACCNPAGHHTPQELLHSPYVNTPLCPKAYATPRGTHPSYWGVVRFFWSFLFCHSSVTLL